MARWAAMPASPPLAPRRGAGPARGPAAPARVDRAHQEPHQAAAARRHRRDRPRQTSTGSAPRRCVACRPSAVVNAAPSISRPLPQPRPGDPASRPASRWSTTSARRSWSRSQEGDRLRVDGRRASTSATTSSPTGTALRRRRRRGRDERGRAPGSPYSWRPSPPTRWSTCAGSASCCSTASACPTSRTELDGRHALVVVRGYHYKEDLQTLRPLHPRVPAGADRGGRRRGRPARGRATGPTSSSATWTRSPTRR